MKTIIWVDGGIGRVITSIPALLKYHKNHLNEEWYLMIPGWSTHCDANHLSPVIDWKKVVNETYIKKQKSISLSYK